MSHTGEPDGSTVLPQSTLEHCIPLLFSIKGMATDYEQNTLPHYFSPLFQPSIAVIYYPHCVQNNGKKTSFVKKIILASRESSD